MNIERRSRGFERVHGSAINMIAQLLGGPIVVESRFIDQSTIFQK